MSETERLEEQLKQRTGNRLNVESNRKRQSMGTVEHAVEAEFNKVNEQIKNLPDGQKEILIHLNVAENLLPIAKAYDEAVRRVLETITEYNVKVRSKEIKIVMEKFEEFGALSNAVLASLRDIVVRLDKFTGNLELEREVLLSVKAELNR